MAKAISSTKLSDTLTISLCRDGYWLYDTTRGMNLAMRATTQEAAFVEALTYYQKRLIEVEKAYSSIESRVMAFVSQFVDDGD